MMTDRSWDNSCLTGGPQGSFPAGIGVARAFQTVPWMLLAILLLAATCCFAGAVGNSKPRSVVLSPNAVRCKYSVRDVAFVNVHGKNWQLQLIKPADAGDAQLETWNKTIRHKLAQSNVGYIWLNADSQQANWLQNQFGTESTGRPIMALTGPDEIAIPVDDENGDENLTSQSLDQQLDQILQSPARQEILSHVVDALCVFVLVESDDEHKNAAVRKMCSNAIERINGQMWTLEKPTDQGPALVTISNQNRSSETWLLNSLGIENDASPAIAIVYGQGRRLGDVLTGDDLTVEKMVGRASVCGRDCECNLNRDWLYGRQMIHVWNQELERAAERSLTFDPNSAFVIAEVAQIIKKNTLNSVADQRIDLGAGLIVHDLDTNPGLPSAEAAEIPASGKTQPVDISPDSPADRPESELASEPSSIQNLAIPWPLMVGLLSVLAVVIVWFQWKASSRQ